jgi:2-haloacid dehalogenase
VGASSPWNVRERNACQNAPVCSGLGEFAPVAAIAKGDSIRMKYEVLLFDADNTLFNYDQAEEYALQQAFQRFNLDYNEGWLNEYRAINASFWRMLENGTIQPAELRYKRFEALFENRLQVDPVSFSEAYLSKLSEGRFLLEGALEVVVGLASKYILAIVTNGLKEVQLPRFQGSPLSKYIKTLIISEEVGYKKPDPGMFDCALKAVHHTDRSSVIMIGDSLTSDIKGGFDYGIDTCWYNPRGLLNQSGIRPTYEIRDLHELLEIL